MSSPQDNQSSDPQRGMNWFKIDNNQDQLGLLLDIYRGYLLKIAGQELSQSVSVKIAPSDLVQDTMLRATQGFLQFRGTTEPELKEWLKQILIHNITDAKRKFFGTEKRDASREVPLPGDLPEAEQKLISESRPVKSPLSDLVTHETSDQVHHAIQLLSEKDREIIDLRNFQQLGFPEIGLKLVCSEEAARKKWVKALKNLQAELMKNDPNFPGTR